MQRQLPSPTKFSLELLFYEKIITRVSFCSLTIKVLLLPAQRKLCESWAHPPVSPVPSPGSGTMEALNKYSLD